MNTLEVHTTATPDGVAVVTLVGELDIDTSTRVEQELRRIERTGPPTIVLDLRELTFIDSTGLRLVVAADVRAREQGRRLAVLPGPSGVQRVFRITTLDERLDFTDPAAVGIE